MRYVGFFVFWIMLSAISVSRADTANVYSNIHRIGVISAIGDEVVLHKRGITVFDAKHGTFNLGWNVDRQILNYLTQTLSIKFKLQPVTADADTLRRLVFDKGMNTPDLGSYLKSLPSASNVDAFIVLAPIKVEETANPAAYSKTFFGLGIYRDTGLFRAPDYVMAYAAYDLLVIDSKSGNLIAWAPSRTWGDAPYREGAITSACPANIWAEPSDLTDDQKTIIRDEMKILVLLPLPKMLTIAGLPSDNSIAAQLPNMPDDCRGGF